MLSKFPLLLLLAALALPFASCNNDDEDDGDGGGGANPSLVGAWLISDFSSEGCTDPADNISYDASGDNCEEDQGIEVCLDEYRITFNADGSYVLSIKTSTTVLGQTIEDTTDLNGTYSTSGSTLTLCDEDGDCSDGTYSISGSNVTMNYSDDDDGCDTEIRGSRI